jgi:hypothetical protein
MHNVHNKFRIGIALGFLLLTCSLRADTLTISLDSFALTGSPGSLLTFTGTVLNNSGAEVFLNGAGGNLSYSELTLDVSPFLTFSPLSLLDGQSYIGPLFSVAVSSIALSGDYPGTFTIQGGADSVTFDTVGTQDFQVSVSSVSSVPEPASGLLLGFTLAVMIPVLVYRQRRGAVRAGSQGGQD